MRSPFVRSERLPNASETPAMLQLLLVRACRALRRRANRMRRPGLGSCRDHNPERGRAMLGPATRDPHARFRSSNSELLGAGRRRRDARPMPAGSSFSLMLQMRLIWREQRVLSVVIAPAAHADITFAWAGREPWPQRASRNRPQVN